MGRLARYYVHCSTDGGRVVYTVHDRQQGHKQVGEFSSHQAASQKCDRLNGK